IYGTTSTLLFLCALLVPACSEEVTNEALTCKGAGLLLVSIDTLRADRLGCYGNPRGLTPVLDRIADEGIVFEDVYANSPKTASSHMSLFTSMLPTVHGVTNYSRRLKCPLVTLAKNRLTIAQVLNRNGYWNAAIASGANILAEMGFSKGFNKRFSSVLRPVDQVVDETLLVAEKALKQNEPPFFFVHTYQVHSPYTPPPEYRERFAATPRGLAGELMAEMFKLDFQEQWKNLHHGLWDHKEKFGPEDAAYLSDLYDGEVAYTDAELGRLFAGLRRLGLFDKMVVVILADHGEEFFEHGDFEHDQLYGEHLHVPLIVRLPEGLLGGTRVRGMASLIDVMPTLLDLLQIEGPEEQMMGHSLVPAIRSGRTRNEPIITERVMYADAYQAAMRSDKGNVIFRAREGELEAYLFSNDPKEKNNIAWKSPFFTEASQALKQALTRTFAQRAAWDQDAQGEAAELDSSRLEELKQLGYLSNQGQEFKPVEGTPLEQWPASDRAE
ncbi:MAG: sulfatase, partial [Planctomycetes bacterium]|nr:sulfatase [Planctomycetota bacterium]